MSFKDKPGGETTSLDEAIALALAEAHMLAEIGENGPLPTLIEQCRGVDGFFIETDDDFHYPYHYLTDAERSEWDATVEAYVNSRFVRTFNTFQTGENGDTMEWNDEPVTSIEELWYEVETTCEAANIEVLGMGSSDNEVHVEMLVEGEVEAWTYSMQPRRIELRPGYKEGTEEDYLGYVVAERNRRQALRGAPEADLSNTFADGVLTVWEPPAHVMRPSSLDSANSHSFGL